MLWKVIIKCLVDSHDSYTLCYNTINKQYLMELKEYVSTVLTQIIEGVVTASKIAIEKDAYVNPVYDEHINNSGWMPVYGENSIFLGSRAITNVKFDIGIVVSDSSESEVSGGATLLEVFSLKGRSSEDTLNSSISKVSFEVKVALPHSLTEEKIKFIKREVK